MSVIVGGLTMYKSEIAKNILQFLEGIDIYVGERGFYGTDIYFVHSFTKREYDSSLFNLTGYLRNGY